MMICYPIPLGRFLLVQAKDDTGPCLKWLGLQQAAEFVLGLQNITQDLQVLLPLNIQKVRGCKLLGATKAANPFYRALL